MSVQTMSSQSDSVKASAVQASAVQASALSALNKPVLNINAQGAAVTELQNLLNGYATYLANSASSSFTVAVDGDFGSKTLKAVKAFQRQVFLPRTGTVANLTWQALYLRGPVNMPTLQYISPTAFSIGNSVKLLEEALFQVNYLASSQVNTSFGTSTQTAVMNYQLPKGLTVDGIVGAATWFSLSRQYRPLGIFD